MSVTIEERCLHKMVSNTREVFDWVHCTTKIAYSWISMIKAKPSYFWNSWSSFYYFSLTFSVFSLPGQQGPTTATGPTAFIFQHRQRPKRLFLFAEGHPQWRCPGQTQRPVGLLGQGPGASCQLSRFPQQEQQDRIRFSSLIVHESSAGKIKLRDLQLFRKFTR